MSFKAKWVWLGNLSALAVAACGEVQSLGEDHGSGGAQAVSPVSSGGSASSSGGAASAGEGPITNGGSVSPPSSAGAGGDAAPSPYPLAPTMPIDPSCGCADPNFVCNAAAECVERCDDDGDCARQLLDRAVVDLRLDGQTLYALEAPKRDRLGNLLDEGQRLLRIDTTGLAAPETIATLATNTDPTSYRYGAILGRSADTTYLETDAVYAVGDDGSVATLSVPSDYFKVVQRGDALYFTNADGVWQRGLGVDEAPAQILSSPIDSNRPSIAAGDQLWFWSGAKLCAFDPSATGAGPTCVKASGDIAAASGPYAIVQCTSHGDLCTLRLNRSSPFSIFSPSEIADGADSTFATVSGNTAYSFVYNVPNSHNVRFARFSIESATAPEDALPVPVITAAATAQPQNAAAPEAPLLAVGDAGIFWVQRPGGHDDFSRYLFRRAP